MSRTAIIRTKMKKKSTMPLRTLTLICLIFAAQSRISAAQPDSDRMVAQSSERVAGLSYADIADLADAAPLVAQARIGNLIKLKPGQAGAVPPGHQRRSEERRVGKGGVSTCRYR